jgi:hypothetical protein
LELYIVLPIIISRMNSITQNNNNKVRRSLLLLFGNGQRRVLLSNESCTSQNNKNSNRTDTLKRKKGALRHRFQPSRAGVPSPARRHVMPHPSGGEGPVNQVPYYNTTLALKIYMLRRLQNTVLCTGVSVNLSYVPK